ncbi:MAG: T9SS type A sorting domain-containing protein, partial [Bacteroidales bacterium]|nr:T9SS type A sorting domain-containing protein [Bacteroidales bacterium]
HTVRAIANDNWRGRVDGGGIYYLGEVAELSATPYEPYFFARWDDGDTTNPRHIVVESDTTLTAFFDTASRGTIGIAPVEANAASFFTLTPNPATVTVTVTVGILNSPMVLTLTDAAGREVLRKELSTLMNVSPDTGSQFSIPIDISGLAAGTYFVTLSTPTATGTQRLVVK